MSLPEHASEGADPHDVRMEALRRLRRHQPADLSALKAKDLQELIHELEVHQAEMEVQNEELRRAQVELAQARNRYEDLYEFAPVGYLTLDRQGEILQANLAAAKLLCGMERRAFVGRRIERLVVKEDRDTCYGLLRDTAAFGGARTREFRLQCADGSARWVSATASSLTGPPGQEAAGFRVTLSDIQERKKVEQQLQELTATLERRVIERTAQLRLLAAQLSQAEQRERHRLAKVLHDHLQQLLVGAKLSLGIVRNHAIGEELLRAVQQVNELLDESMAASRSLTVEMSPPILNEGTMRQVLDWLARWMHEKNGLTVRLEVDEQVNAQREEFRVLVFEAIRELLLNTVKHAGVLAATVRVAPADDGQVQVVVADEGVGFDPAGVQPTDQSGFGLLGLRQRLGVLGGRVQIDSAPGRGTRVRFVVPTDLPEATVARILQPAEVPAGCLTGPSGPAEEPLSSDIRIRVLLADDHAVVRDGLARLLMVQKGFEVVGQASDGEQARDMALQLLPDVVIMDVSMPRLGGMEATRQILSRLPATCVIGLSMHADADIAVTMREAGAAAYLAKSTQPEILVATIRECAGKRARP